LVPLAGKDLVAEILATKPDLLINNSYGSELVCPVPVGIYICMFPVSEAALPRSYSAVTANSQFTACWIGKRWGMNAEVVYSPCETMGPPGGKEKIILNVGRFFAPNAQNHHKRQDLLLEIFRRMPDAHEDGWELRFVGNIGAQSADPDFVDQLQAEARDLPVRFHFSMELSQLRELYRRASVYWHATGFGFDEHLHPLKQEHFGMSIVEAMSAGVVPLAFNGGGPRETIAPNVNGFLWNNPDELQDYTRRLIHDDELRERMSKAAVVASRRFTQGEFLSRMDAIIERLTARRREPTITCAS
jgi:glycosyltransferase involved in cell wall biosynthesis